MRDRVDHAAWTRAQDWERQFWVQTEKRRSVFGKSLAWRLLSVIGLKPRYRGDDWNHWWKSRFRNYSFLPQDLENVVELGCGPYSNMRMLDHCRIRHAFLSDPLIRTYIGFRLSFVAQMYRSGRCFIDDHPIEECPFAESYFDAVLMINVLDHVRDADICLRKAAALAKPGGWFVMGQALTNEQDVHSLQGLDGEAGHPIKLEAPWIDERIHDMFQPTVCEVLPREAGQDPPHHYGTYLFAGRKMDKAL